MIFPKLTPCLLNTQLSMIRDTLSMQPLNKYALSATALVLMAATGLAAPPITEITLPGTRIFPESITSTSDGTLIVASLGHGNVLRIAPGSTTAEDWIKAGTGALNQVLGV